MSSGSSFIGNDDSTQKALHACSSCRKHKKGCDKAIPKCSACVRLNRNCEYGTGSSPPPFPEGYESLKRRVAKLENELSQHRAICESQVGLRPSKSSLSTRDFAPRTQPTSDFPSAFFLDVELFQRSGLKAPKPDMAIPVHVLNAIGDDVEIRTVVGAHFFSVFPWMAVVSRKKLYKEISVPCFALDPSVALLVLCMKLLDEKQAVALRGPRNSLYEIAKNFYSAVESCGIGSIRLIQAGIMIILYEIGHGIAPEAYMSIGRTGRLGHAIGLHDTARVPQLGLEPESWDDMEERRRVWWAAYILDRYMNIGNPSRSLALADEAGRGEFLPVDDKAWEQGETVASEPLFVSSSTNIAAAPFARLCQASHLLSLVLSHVTDRGGDVNLRLEEATQLSRALLSLFSFLQPETSFEATRVCVAIPICFSALITLYEHSSKAGLESHLFPAETELRELGNFGLQSLLPDLITYATHVQTILPFNIDQASPLIAHCLYRTGLRLSRSAVEAESGEYERALNLIKDTLSKLDSRWKLAGEYLRLLEENGGSLAVVRQEHSFVTG